jgi:hypothetical protein
MASSINRTLTAYNDQSEQEARTRQLRQEARRGEYWVWQERDLRRRQEEREVQKQEREQERPIEQVALPRRRLIRKPKT